MGPSAETLASQPSWVLLGSAVGTFTVLRFSFFLLLWLYTCFLRPYKNLFEYGRWAVVTGPTDGIGKTYAFELARRGLNLVLVGRSPEKLSQVAAAIKAQVPTADLRTAVVDLAGDLATEMGRLESVIRGIEVGILVNNARVINVDPLYLHEMDETMLGSILKVNLVGMTEVLRTVLPGMLRRGRGTIINVSSGTAVVVPSFPFFSAYAATKAYIRNMSRSLHQEYKHAGLHVQCQIPLYVATKMVPTRRPSLFSPQPMDYTRPAIRSIGYGIECIPYWPHSLQSHLIKLVPADYFVNQLVLWKALKSRK